MHLKKGNISDTPPKTLLHQQLSFAATEAYKLLRANLMFTVPNEHRCRIIGVTSSIRGEGKSTTAINLSYTLAETDKKVLLIDCDLRLPSVAKKLNIKGTPGLSNVLAGTTTEETAVLKFQNTESLFILPSGDIPPNPAEMLGSLQMAALLKKKSKKYDFIVLDLPPVNIVSDALVVAPFVDGMIVVFRDEYSEQRALNTCMNQLTHANVKILGFVMNGTTDGSSKRYKYYKSNHYKRKFYKHYGYHYQERTENTEQKKSTENLPKA